ncbi:MAG: hypothetical protein PHD60_01925 [Clostridia bacterium]|nr:hypothetical protein [Clostridia bacterium]
MVICTHTVIALRCSSCGKINVRSLSRFDFSGVGSVKLFCECGNSLANINKKGKNIFCLQVRCFMCETKHRYLFRKDEVWNKYVIPIKCEGTAMRIGFMGIREKVIENISQEENSYRQMVEELGYNEECSDDFNIINKTVDYLSDMLEEGKMSCSCGNSQLEVDAFQDRVEINCPHCNATGVVFVKTRGDLRRIYDMKCIKLEAYSCRCFYGEHLEGEKI